MSKSDSIAYDIVQFLIHPADGIEIGGVAEQLINILKGFTKSNDRLLKHVSQWIEYEKEDVSEQIELLEEYKRMFYK